MKNVFRVLGIAALAAVIGFGVAACGNGSPAPLTAVTPTASPAAGTYTAAQSVTLNTATAGASIYYTTDGSAPTTGSTPYLGAINISATTTLKAIAVKEGMNNSAVLTAVYTISGSSRPAGISITINKTGDETGDSISASPTSGQVGDEIILNYTLANTKHNNRLAFSGTAAPIAEADSAETGTRTYTIAEADAADGVITINAVFTHSDKTLDTIAFEDANNVTKTYGDAPFTRATSAGSGTGVITYTSSDITVATVSNSGTVTILKVGSTIITATKAEDTAYSGDTAFYELTVEPLQLTITDPAVTTTKLHDGNTTAAVTAGTLTNKVGNDDVTVTATAAYASANVGNDINITVVYAISGADAANYIKPVNYTTSGSITNTLTAVALQSVTFKRDTNLSTDGYLTLTFDQDIPGLCNITVTWGGVSYNREGIQFSGSSPYRTYFNVPSGSDISGTMTVAVSKTGYIISGSPREADMYATWNGVDASSVFGLNTTIQTIAYGNGTFVAAGDSGKMAYSTNDGVTWTAVTSTSIYNGDWFSSIAYGDGTFVAVSSNGILYSTDNGITWARGSYNPVDYRASPLAVAYGDGKFVATFSRGETAYSTDNGKTWKSAFLNYTRFTVEDDVIAIAYGNGEFVVGGSGGKMASWSGRVYGDGSPSSWNSSDGKIPSTYTVSLIAYVNDKFIAYGGNENGGAYSYLSKGSPWTTLNGLNNFTYRPGIAYGNGKFVAIGKNLSQVFTTYSSDGLTWTDHYDEARPSILFYSVSGSSSLNYYVSAIAYGNGKFVAVGSKGKIAWRNAD